MSEIIEIEIPDFVAELLEPIPGNSAVGIDVGNDPEYFKLSMEIPKVTPDYKNWIELSNLILKEKSKDLKVVSWLVFAFYRTENIKGLKNGLSLLLHMLQKYGNELHPSNPLHKSKAIQFIASGRVVKFLEKENIDKSNASDITECEKLLNDINRECEKLFSENIPVLKPLIEVISTLVKSIPSVSPPEKVEKKEEKKPETVTSSQEEKIVKDNRIAQQDSNAGKQSSIQETLLSEQDAINQLRKTITFFFEYEEEGEVKQRVPENLFVFGLSRQIQWSNIIRPIDSAGVTSIEAPNKIIQGLVKDWFNNNNHDLLIARVESEFIKANSEFRFWLDAQRYVVNALSKKGGNYKAAIDDIRFYLSRLLQKYPDLPQLKFKDKQTPFADADTIQWIDEEVKNIFSSNGTGSNNAIPPIISEDYEYINNEYQAVSNDLPENFEKNLLSMQTGLNNEKNIKGRFLRRLNIADFYFHHREFLLARINLLELKEIINSYKLAGWEQALCTAVWRTLYLTNKEILNNTKDDNLKKKIEPEQEELFYEIGKYDGVLALKLTKQKK